MGQRGQAEDLNLAADALVGGGFVMVRPVEEGRQLVVAVNWSQELRQRIGGSK